MVPLPIHQSAVIVDDDKLYSQSAKKQQAACNKGDKVIGGKASNPHHEEQEVEGVHGEGFPPKEPRREAAVELFGVDVIRFQGSPRGKTIYHLGFRHA